jgi:DNA topoisomerase III
MGKSLVITEKPSVARDIVAALGGFQEHDGFWESDEYVVTFSVGHIVELLEPEDIDPQYKRWTLDTLPILPDEFKLKKKSGASERVRAIEKLLERKDIDDVVNACDAGREGELIFREILDYLECRKPVRRLWLQSMTKTAITTGFQSLQPGERFEALGEAAACRSRSDWLIGMNATRALTRRLKSRKEKTAWSAGRVQTPTLAIVVDRELEVLAHVPRPYSRIEARFRASDHEYAGSWFDPAFEASEDQTELKDDRLFDDARARTILESLAAGAAATAEETRKPSRETAPPLFDLTSLQREGNRRFGWSARRTLNAAQRCYEAHKVLTYPRTDSRCLPNDYRQTVQEVLQSLSASEDFGPHARFLVENGLENTERTFDDAKVSDHFAIIPTGKLPEAPLSGDDARLFELVTARFLATFHPPATWMRVERTTQVGEQHFRSRSRTLEEPGWRAVVGQTEQEDQALPALIDGQDEAQGVRTSLIDTEQVFENTRPPARYTEARLLSLMENAGKDIEDEDYSAAISEKGIGTPATRADVIENLIGKGYLVRLGKGLRPTVKGVRLIDVLRRIQIDRLASAELTGELEFHLRQVERGERTGPEFMDEIKTYTREIVERACQFEYEELYANDAPLGACPSCGRPVYERSWFYRCEEVPGVDPEQDCKFRLWKDKAGRYMDRETARTLLEKGETRELEGFSYRDGRTYNGVLKLEDLELKIAPVAGSAGERTSDVSEYEVDDRPLGPCPVDNTNAVIEQSAYFVCASNPERETKPREDGTKPCPFVLPRTVCKREITRDEAVAYITNKRTEQLTDFTSRYGRPFAATLFLKENGRHGFEFAPRGAKKDAAAAAEGGAEGAEAAAAKPKRKSSRKAATAAPAAPGAEGAPAARKQSAAKTPKAAAKKTARKTAAKKTATKKSPAKKSAKKAAPKASGESS